MSTTKRINGLFVPRKPLAAKRHAWLTNLCDSARGDGVAPGVFSALTAAQADGIRRHVSRYMTYSHGDVTWNGAKILSWLSND